MCENSCHYSIYGKKEEVFSGILTPKITFFVTFCKVVLKTVLA
ncbi:hypothetical protein FAEPRAM212_01016 [Faecalibacterium prausnitzii M21/2]|uniref:Uncharacterized protein n=1 Tax=Faecalibacterium prausnitzii M21/2 TaxID=411485 RepID=A8S9C5_9FIRM|nr:hypothetical protein FAEPRAM212_01016 [Faecalibacterium prausnitzii M21/2]